MDTLDYRKELKSLYSPSAKKVELVQVPCLHFLRIDGIIEPGKAPGTSPAFAAAVSALYTLSYTLKFMLKKRAENPVDYKVMALEALWWVDDQPFIITEPGGWRWSAMIAQPPCVTPDIWLAGRSEAGRKKDNPAIESVRFEPFEEGLCVQVLHLGPYAAEPATVQKMDDFAAEHGYTMHAKHHEIYLSDPLRTAPDKLRTILRHPVKKI
jgi:hypothetical protein